MAGFVDVGRSVPVVANDVVKEVYRAIDCHGSMHSLHEAHSVLEEKFDEFWELVKLNPKKMTETVRAAWKSNIRMELIQVAAMCVRTILDCNLVDA